MGLSIELEPEYDLKIIFLMSRRISFAEMKPCDETFSAIFKKNLDLSLEILRWYLNAYKGFLENSYYWRVTTQNH